MTGRHRKGTGGRLAGTAALLAGFGLLVWLYWPVIISGLIGFAGVWFVLSRRWKLRPLALLNTVARWVEAVAVWRISRNLPPAPVRESLSPVPTPVYDVKRRGPLGPDESLPF